MSIQVTREMEKAGADVLQDHGYLDAYSLVAEVYKAMAAVDETRAIEGMSVEPKAGVLGKLKFWG